METEFRHLSFDVIRYSMVWEGSSSVTSALQTTEEDELLIICSAGCNVLNMLLQPCKRVWAVDLNPLQIKLLELKVKVIMSFPYEVYSGLLGFDGALGMATASTLVLEHLDKEHRQLWAPIFAEHPEGLLLAGRLEKYICQFYYQLDDRQKELMNALFEATDLDQQNTIFSQLQSTNFEEIFVEYFSRQQLSHGRDPALFKYTQEAGGDRFYERLCEYLSSHLLGDSYISRFFFYGPAGMPQHLRPPCYQMQHYEQLGQQFHRLELVVGEAIDFLESTEGANVNKASFSNIFEYASPEVFSKTVSALLQRPQLRFVYWNLLNNQGEKLRSLPSYQAEASLALSHEEDCFYFSGLHVFDNKMKSINPKNITHEQVFISR